MERVISRMEGLAHSTWGIPGEIPASARREGSNSHGKRRHPQSPSAQRTLSRGRVTWDDSEEEEGGGGSSSRGSKVCEQGARHAAMLASPMGQQILAREEAKQNMQMRASRGDMEGGGYYSGYEW
jgi:hypothetical protein